VAGWNDRGAVADAARQSLRGAAGIEVPRSGFVFQVLVAYVLVLAPLNWLVFRIVRRVEWAWAAAPIIAIAGAIVVVRLAQLDIGFARSRTEFAMLELRGGYPRGHLTRYTALYTSLSTSYDFLFDDDSALAMPFPHSVPYRRGLHEAIKEVHFRRDRQVSLSGYQVPSNFTGLVHSEQMLALRGSIQLAGSDESGWRVQNGTDIALQDVGVIRRRLDGQLESAWVGVLEPAAWVPLTFRTGNKDAFLDPWKDSPACLSYERQKAELVGRHDRNRDRALTLDEVQGDPSLVARFQQFDLRPRDGRLDENELLEACLQSRGGQLTLGRLVDLACEAHSLRNGDVRLIAWTDRKLPGLAIRPEASQEMLRTFVLVHLQDSPYPPAERDENLRAEVDRAPETQPTGASEGDVLP
jgi:hypothetical protein